MASAAATATTSEDDIRRLLFWHRPNCPNRDENCVAQFNFQAKDERELSFRKGHAIRLLKPSDGSPYWWWAQRSDGDRKSEGYVPINYLRLEDDEPLVPDYEEMMTKIFPPGTQVQARVDSASGDNADDLHFKRGDLMYIINHLDERQGWYKVRLVTQSGKPCPFKEGVVHSNLLESVYEVYQSRTNAVASSGEKETLEASGIEPIYETFEEFQEQSWWFDMPKCRKGSLDALFHRLASRAEMTDEGFMTVKEAIYTVRQTINGQFYVGAASILHKELTAHFLSWDKPESQKTLFDKELFEVPSCFDWELQVFPLEAGQNLNVERAKKIVEKKSLQPNGLNEEMTFTTQEEWEEFEKWFFIV